MAVEIKADGEYASIVAHCGYGTPHRISPSWSDKAAFRLVIDMDGSAADFAADGTLVANSLVPEHVLPGLTEAAHEWVAACTKPGFGFTLDGGLAD